MGITLPLTELVAREAPPNFHQPFYLYLYGVSILFCSFLFVARWRRAAQLEFLSQCPGEVARRVVHLSREVSNTNHSALCIRYSRCGPVWIRRAGPAGPNTPQWLVLPAHRCDCVRHRQPGLLCPRFWPVLRARW